MLSQSSLFVLTISLSFIAGVQCQPNATNIAAVNKLPKEPMREPKSSADSRNATLPLALSKSAPYTIDSNGEADRAGSRAGDSMEEAMDSNLALKRLIETLSSNNYTASEIKFNGRNSNTLNFKLNANGSERADLEVAPGGISLNELLDDANDAKWKLMPNASSVVKDNHKYLFSQLARFKPATAAAPTDQSAVMTVPPIRRTLDVVAENYTAKKIADEANVFAFKLLNQLNTETLGSHNIIQSPFAVYQGLALLLAGAMGDTAKELDRVLLGSQSVYENTKLTHDQDRNRLIDSLGQAIKQLQQSATNHWSTRNNFTSGNLESLTSQSGPPYYGGTSQQHLIVANNLLFSPNAFEIASEFSHFLSSYHNNTALTKTEAGSTEAIQVVNAWIRRATAGIIPTVFNKKSTFDEFNVMTMLSTSWLAQEWRDDFRRVASPIRSTIRLKGQSVAVESNNGTSSNNNFPNRGRNSEALLEFVDDNKGSHFVDFIRSRPTKNIQHYHTVLGGQVVDVVVVPFRESNQRLVTITPLVPTSGNPSGQSIFAPNSVPESQQFSGNSLINGQPTSTHLSSGRGASQNVGPEPLSASLSPQMAPDTSVLSRLISSMAANPKRALRSLWATIDPDIITKQTLANIPKPQPSSATGRQEHVLISSIPPRVQLSIPLIKTGADASISAALNHIGVVNSFDPAQANFIGINGHPFNYNKLHLSNVISKTTFNLNEAGINYDRTIKTLEALRVYPENRGTGSDASNMEDTLKYELIDDVKLNKPFLYLICDFNTNLILSTGVLRNPSQQGSG